MSNLLPSDARKKAWGDARNRMIRVGALLISGALFVALVALAPSAFAIYVARTHLMNDAFGVQGGNALVASTTMLSQAQTVVAQISSFPATTSPEVIRAALVTRPRGVTISNISYTIGMPSVITLSGVASSPDLLAAYKSALSADPHFSSVSLPLNTLLGSQDGRFTITLSGRF